MTGTDLTSLSLLRSGYDSRRSLRTPKCELKANQEGELEGTERKPERFFSEAKSEGTED